MASCLSLEVCQDDSFFPVTALCVDTSSCSNLLCVCVGFFICLNVYRRFFFKSFCCKTC